MAIVVEEELVAVEVVSKIEDKQNQRQNNALDVEIKADKTNVKQNG